MHLSFLAGCVQQIAPQSRAVMFSILISWTVCSDYADKRPMRSPICTKLRSLLTGAPKWDMALAPWHLIALILHTLPKDAALSPEPRPVSLHKLLHPSESFSVGHLYSSPTQKVSTTGDISFSSFTSLGQKSWAGVCAAQLNSWWHGISASDRWGSAATSA